MALELQYYAECTRKILKKKNQIQNMPSVFMEWITLTHFWQKATKTLQKQVRKLLFFMVLSAFSLTLRKKAMVQKLKSTRSPPQGESDYALHDCIRQFEDCLSENINVVDQLFVPPKIKHFFFTAALKFHEKNFFTLTSWL